MAGFNLKIKKEHEKYMFAILFVLFIFLIVAPSAILIIWFLNFLSFSGITTWPPTSPNKFLSITGISLAMICAIIGVGGSTGMLDVDKKVQLVIWSSFLSGVLVAVLKWLKIIDFG